MNEAKYIGLDVHQATISVSVLDFSGKLVMEAILETKAETVLQFVHGLRGSLHVTLEEGTCAACHFDRVIAPYRTFSRIKPPIIPRLMLSRVPIRKYSAKRTDFISG